MFGLAYIDLQTVALPAKIYNSMMNHLGYDTLMNQLINTRIFYLT